MNRSCNIARLRRRLALEQYVDTPDQGGGFARQWQTLGSLWGEVQMLRAERAFIADQAFAQATHRILIRWRPDITGEMRFRDGLRTYAIVAAHDADNHRRYLVCHCREETP